MDSPDKMLHTLHNMLHAQVMALADMVFERVGNITGESESELHNEWRDRRRQEFLDTTQRLLVHPDLPNLIPAITMTEIAEAIWRLEDKTAETPDPSDPSLGDGERT